MDRESTVFYDARARGVFIDRGEASDGNSGFSFLFSLPLYRVAARAYAAAATVAAGLYL